MEKAIEFDIQDEKLKKYLEECLKENNIKYEITTEDRWIQKYKEASKYYQVYCLYVNSNNFKKVKKIISDYKNGTIVIDDIEELKDTKDNETDNRFKIFTVKNFLKYYWIALIVIGILMIIGMKFTM